METQENPTSGDAGASTLERLESFLSPDETPVVQDGEPTDEPQQTEDAPTETDETDSADEPKPESETPNEYQLSDVAKLLGADESALDVDEDGAITVKTKVDGVEGKAKFADLLKSYQLQGHVDKQVREVAEMRKAAIEERQASQQQIQVQQAIIGKIAQAKAIESELAKYEGVNWSALIAQDPQQAMQLRQQRDDLQGKLNQSINEVNQAGQHVQQLQANQSAATLQAERQALIGAIPEWSDDVIATKEKSLISADLQSRGYTAEDIRGLSDHKAVLLARDAMLYRQGKTTNAATEKIVRAAPKIIKPGTTQSVSRNDATLQKIKSSVRSTGGSKQSVMDYLLATGKV